MPSIEVNKADLEKLVGKKFSRKELEDALLYVKGEISSIENNNLKIDVKETNRPDLWSAEGIAREIKARLGMKKGLPVIDVVKGKYECFIEKSVEKSRPFIACCIIRNVKLNDEFLKQMIQLQEKIALTFGRKRKEAGIGLYDFDKMKMPVYYKGFKDNDIEFTPLEFKVKMKPSEVLKEHPKGKEFGHLLANYEYYPIVIDSANVVASMPPIINSEETGKITEKTKNIFLEVTGFNWQVVNVALKVMALAFYERGATIEAIKIHFPKGKIYPKKPEIVPCFNSKKISFDFSLIEKITGLKLSEKQVIELLARAQMNATIKKGKISVEYSDIRQDILHPVDIVEDILISYGYNKIEPLKVELPVVGSERSESLYIDKVRELCIGLQLQEVLTFVLTSKEKQLSRMLLDEHLVEILNPVSIEYSVMRKRLLPELLEFLAKNKHAAMPQKLFEVGRTLSLDESKETKVRETENLCIVLTGKNIDFNLIKSHLNAITEHLGLRYSMQKKKLSFFKEGLSAEITIGKLKGFIGMLNEKVKQSFGLKEEVAVLELELLEYKD